MRLFGLIGYPLGHSFSSSYFGQKFDKEGHKAVYRNFEIAHLSSLPGIINDNPELEGLNVTLPYKREVLQYLDELDPLASETGAVNVIKIIRQIDSTVLKGYNTDIKGFVDSLKPLLKSNISDALILGSGGSSLAVKKGLEILGINFKTVSRTSGAGDFVYKDLNREIVNQFPLIINTTPVGMYPDVSGYPDIPYEDLTQNNVLFDLVYNPALSSFLLKGREKGCVVIGGLEMLHIQAEQAWAVWNSPG